MMWEALKTNVKNRNRNGIAFKDMSNITLMNGDSIDNNNL